MTVLTASNTMRAATVVAPGEIRVDRFPIPEPGAGEIRLRVQGCGVCASNLSPWEGKPWFTYPMEPGQLGHESWGFVDAVGKDVRKFKVGDRVSMLSNHAYAEYDVASENSAIRLPNVLDDMPFPAEPLGCAVNIHRRGDIKPGQTVAIIGIGFLGALLTRLASESGANVIAISRRQYALDVANAMGAKETVVMDDHWRIIEEVKALTGGVFCDVVVEAVGKQWPLDLAAELTRERGRLIVAGYHQDGPRQVNMQLWNWRGIDVINAHERDEKVYVDGMRRASDLIANRKLDPQPLYTHTFPLEDLDAALNMTRDRPDGFMKALIMM